MKICSSCQTKNNDDSVFCKKCGKKFKKETDISKVVLLVGVFLVLFSSIFFGIFNWGNMNNLFRFLFFCFETCLFYIMSLALNKTSNKISRIFFVIGLLLTPFTLSMVPYYNLIPSILYNKSLIFIYLAIIYLLTFVGYLLVNIKFKGKILNYLALLSLLISIIFACLIFTKNIVIIGLVITVYMLVVNLFSKILKNKIYYYFSLILSFFVVPFLLVCFLQTEKFEIIINSVTMAIFAADTYIKLSFNEKTILHFFAPFMLQGLTFTLIGAIPTNYIIIEILIITLVNIALYFVTLIFKNKVLSITTLVLTYLMIGLLSLYCMIVGSSMELAIVSGICLLFSLSLVIFKKYNFAHFLITINVLTLISGLNSWLYNFDTLIIVGFLSILYLIIYLVLNLISNKYDFIYLIIMMLIGLFAGLFMFVELSGFSLIKLIICITFAIGFILCNVFKEHAGIRITWFVIFNILTLPLFSTAYYSLLAISIFTILSGIVLSKATKFNFKPYLLYAEIVIFIITLCNTMNYNIYSLFINVLAYILGYVSLVNYHNKKGWKIPYIMVGLLYITKLLGVIVEPVVICSLISLVIILIIIISMYLLDRFNSKELVIISLVSLIPYYTLIEALDTYQYELYLVPFVVYAIILLYVIKFKSNGSKNAFILIPFFTIGTLFILTNTGVVSTIIDVVFALTYIILGLINKNNLLVFFAIGLLILTILLQIFTVLNNISIIITLLVIGFILIFVAVFYSTRKKD